MSGERVYIFDTTLRDGQQSPGAGMTFEDNLRYAEHANTLAIDVLEAGFPAASQTDFDVVQTISQTMADKQSAMTIAALCQLREAQVERTMEALAPSLAIGKACLHTYVPVDPNLMQASLGKLADNKQKIIDDLHDLVGIAAKAGFDVEFSPEGYTKMQDNFDFVTDLIRAAVSAGCRVINCPDTIGGASRIEGDDYFVRKMQRHAAIMQAEFPQQEIIWSVHCHNDFGLALDNSINGVFEGPARQIEGCINGVGERAGNVSLEQCIIYIKEFGGRTNPDKPFYTNINFSHIKPTSDFIADKMLSRQPHTPIVGDNSARHSSGGHTNAVLNNPLAYQPFDPRDIGSEISFVFGPLSGSNHAKQIIDAHGYICDNKEKVEITQAIKDYYADRRKGITDAELIEGYRYYRSPIKVDDITYAKNSQQQSSLVINGNFFGQAKIAIQSHSENSALAALADEVEKQFSGINILDYQSNACDHGQANAKCHSKIIIKTADEKDYQGESVDADIEVSALEAFIDAVNQAYIDKYYVVKE